MSLHAWTRCTARYVHTLQTTRCCARAEAAACRYTLLVASLATFYLINVSNHKKNNLFHFQEGFTF